MNMCDTYSKGYNNITNALVEDVVLELASSPLERRYLRKYGETSRVILDSILEHNSKVTSNLDKALCDIQEARRHMEVLRADLESFRRECHTVRREYEGLRREHDHLLEEMTVLKADIVRCREEAERAESQRVMVSLPQRQLQYKTGDDMDQLLARICKINRGIFE